MAIRYAPAAAARFLLRIQGPLTPSLARRSLLRHGSEIDVYQVQAKPTGTVVFIHGLNSLGHRDPRVERFAAALAKAGFRAVIPAVASLRRLWIKGDQPRQVQNMLEAIAGDRELVPSGRFSMMAVSFSGNFVLRAAASPGLSQQLNAVGLIGAYADVDKVCDFLCTAKRADPYGHLLLLRSYYTEFGQPSPGFIHAIERCIARSIEEPSRWSFESVLSPSDPDQSHLLHLLQDPDARVATRGLIKAALDGAWRDYVPPVASLPPDLPVFLLHGRSDRVIPVGQSRRLAQLLAVRGVSHRLCVTRFLTHGDSRVDWRVLPEVAHVWSSFSWFFRRCWRVRQ